jgi:hypothetical protein
MRGDGAFAAAILAAVLLGCGEPTPDSTTSDRPAGGTASSSTTPQRVSAPDRTRPGCFSREHLIADARQLAEILESTHPDPYINGGGRIAFHRRLHQVLNAIPQEGMTKDEFYRLLRPFVAGVGDAHTNFLGGYDVDRRRPGGVPLRFRVVEAFLVVSGVADPGHRDLLGARLVSVEEVPLAELVERQKQLRGIDNQYHALQTLAEQSLRYKPYLQDLIPEWKDAKRVRVEIQRSTGSTAAIELAIPAQPQWTTPESRVALPSPDESGFLYAFLKTPASQEEVAYVRFTHMVGYREAREGREPLLTKLTQPRSATDTFRSMVMEMKKRGTRTLILDVRGNSGGNSLIVDILVYFLYGKKSLLELNGFGAGESGVFRYSHLYFEDRPGETLEAVNADRLVPLVEGDYEFGWSFVNGEPIAKRTKVPEEPLAFRFLWDSPTFRPEFESGAHEGYYHPEKVMVLCDSGTASAGFSVVVAFHRLGAILVGTPSAQAPNSFGAATTWRLNQTGIEGTVPLIAATHFPNDPEKAHVLRVDYPLTYERLASYAFDPNAEYLYALELRDVQ